MRTVTVAGHLCIDVIPRISSAVDVTPGSLVELGPLALEPGGCVANTGTVLAGLGADVRLVADVGDDELGRILRAKLDGRGLDTSSLRVTRTAGTSYSIVVEPPGVDRTFWHHVGANAGFDADRLDLAGSQALHLGYPPLLPRLIEDGAARLVKILSSAKRVGVTTSLDLAVVQPGSQAAAADWPRLLRATLPHVDVLSPSSDDLRSMFGARATASRERLRTLAGTFIDWGAAVVMVTAGASGLVLQTGSRARLEAGGGVLAPVADRWAETTRWVPARKLTVRSTTGAGDAASAGLLHALLSGWDPAFSGSWVAAVAAAKISGEPVPGAFVSGNV